MYTLNKYFKNGVIFIIIMSLVVAQTFPVYSATGGSTTESFALTANKEANIQDMGVNKEATTVAAATAVGAILAGVVLAGFFAAGVVDGWNSHHPQTEVQLSHNINYQKYDFSEFDN